MIRLDDVELTSADQAVQHYLAAGLLPILVHAPTEITDKPEAACTCGQIHKAAGKHPIASAWQKPRGLDELKNQLARLKYEPNVGVILGSQPAGGYLVAVDVDDEARLAELQDKLGPLPETVRSQSGRGFHLFFELPREIPIDQVKNVTGLGGVKGIDIKAERGQVVVAPSIHLSGRRYTWTRTGEVALLPMAWAMEIAPTPVVPPWVSGYNAQSLKEDKRLKNRAEKYLETAVKSESAMIAATREGSRNDTLYKRACSLFSLCAGSHLGAHWSYVHQELHKAGIACGLSELEVQKTLASAEKWVREHADLRTPVALAQPPKHTNGVHHPATPAPEATTGADSEQAHHWGASPAGPIDPGSVPLPAPGSSVAFSQPLPFDGDPFDHILLVIDKGSPAKTAGNVATMLAQHPEWCGGPMFDLYSHTAFWPFPLPAPIAKVRRLEREFVDSDVDAVEAWLLKQPETHRVRAGTQAVGRGILLAANTRQVDLLRDWINAIDPWDGTSRVDSWLIDYLGCQDNAYTRATGRAWLVALAERALIPGAVVDIIPVLEGLQRSGKNRALQTLFEGGPTWAPWLAIISGINLNHPDNKKLACSRWVFHDDELQASNPKRVEALKSWASREREEFRLPYAKAGTVAHRRALLVGSTNKDTYLHDETGNRRWWPWKTGTIRIDALANDRLQLLAEACADVRSGVRWRHGITDAIYQATLAESERRRVVDPLVEQIERLLAGTLVNGRPVPSPLTTHQIASSLGYSIEKIDKSLQIRIGSVMHELGYVTVRPGTAGEGDKRTRVYQKVDVAKVQSSP